MNGMIRHRILLLFVPLFVVAVLILGFRERAEAQGMGSSEKPFVVEYYYLSLIHI